MNGPGVRSQWECPGASFLLGPRQEDKRRLQLPSPALRKQLYEFPARGREKNTVPNVLPLHEQDACIPNPTGRASGRRPEGLTRASYLCTGTSAPSARAIRSSASTSRARLVAKFRRMKPW
ncbi:hypothetical protein DAERI_090055 [Deinococcus aerius]|uniref:Uncharacterized protein n=1 Tax=Deinococcus aerius TaxID=200253 RepID=A0A2I9CWQ5_9DEIO|nr:hypothetical protein DAERI_090055 [Deinococcus aerius]